MKLNLTLSKTISQPVLIDVVYGRSMTIESVKVESPLAVLMFAFSLTLPTMLYYLRLQTVVAVFRAARRALLMTQTGQAILARFDALVSFISAKLDAFFAPVRARLDPILTPIQARIDTVLAPYREARDFLSAYFDRMALLLATKILGTLPPQAMPGLQDDLKVFLIVWIVPKMYVTCALLIPFALLALVMRTFLRTMIGGLTSLRPKRAPTSTTPFRFLNLPPELRNRIYAYASDAALDAPLEIAYKRPQHCKFDYERKRVQELVVNLLNPFAVTRNTKPAHRLALLFANRQVRQEVAALHFDKMRLDFGFCDLESSLPRMMQFVDIFKDRLQFVRKLEMPLSVAQTFLFNAADNDSLGALGLSPDTMKQILKMRPCFPHVQQVGVYPDHKGITILEDVWDLSNRQAVGFNVLYGLAGSQTRQALNDTFPRLTDILTRNQYGCERFRGLQDGSWKMWYSGQPIPNERAAWEDVMRAFSSIVFDPKTRLTGRLALNWVRA